MPELSWYPSYRDEYAGDDYPFADAARLVSDDGVVTLPRGMFVDASIHPVGGGPRARVSRIDASARSVTITLGDATSADRCSATFDPTDPPAILELADGLGRPAGILVVDPIAIAAARTWPPGTATFRAGSAEFAARCVIPCPDDGVGALVVGGVAVAGDAWLIGEDGVVLTLEAPGKVRIDVVGDPLSARRACGDSFVPPRILLGLSLVDDIHPEIPTMADERGNIRLGVDPANPVDTALRVTPTSEGLRISAVGSKQPDEDEGEDE